VEEGRALADAGGLGHRVGDDDDAVAFAQFVDQFLDLGRGDGVQGRAGLVHQDDFGLDRDGAGDDQTLLLTARQAGAGRVQAVGDLFPQAGALQRGLDDAVQFALLDGQAVDARAVGDVLVDGLGEGVRLLEHHADAGAQEDGVDRLGVDVLTVHLDLAGHLAARDGVVHPVHGAQEGRLAAARRADEGRNRLVRNVQADVEQGLFVAVEDRDVARGDLGRAGGRVGGGHRRNARMGPSSATAGSAWTRRAGLARAGQDLPAHFLGLGRVDRTAAPGAFRSLRRGVEEGEFHTFTTGVRSAGAARSRRRS
jgi:hypothetical protein